MESFQKVSTQIQPRTRRVNRALFGLLTFCLVALSVSSDYSDESDTSYMTSLTTNVMSEDLDIVSGEGDSADLDTTTKAGKSSDIFETTVFLDTGTSCEDHDLRCGRNSVCKLTAEGHKRCVCDDGYRGDGFICLPINPCLTNRGGCENTTNCRHAGPQKHVCECKAGYERYIPGQGCTLQNICTKHRCGPHGVCTTTEPFKITCSCAEGYIWDGTVCVGNILQRLMELNDNDQFLGQKLQYIINLSNRFFHKLMTQPGRVTFFVPIDQAFRNVIKGSKEYARLLDDDERISQFLRQHIVLGQLRTSDLHLESVYTLQGNTATVYLFSSTATYKLDSDSKRAKILVQNLITSNGMIHVVDTLMTWQPHFSGDKEKTVMDLIKHEMAYNRLYTMIVAAGLSEVFSQPNITVFVPENTVWNDLPKGTMDYLLKDEEGQLKLNAILENLVFPGVITVTDLINEKHIMSYANISVKVDISDKGKILLDNNVGVSQVNMAHRSGVYYHIQKIIIPSYMEMLMPHKCDKIENKTVLGDCVNCGGSTECALSTDIPTQVTDTCVMFHGSFDWWDYHHTDHFLRYRYTPSIWGCARKCLREEKIQKCCPGFHGYSCSSCPGGFKNPCNGNGKCNDGMYRNGHCQCEKNFKGTACEFCKKRNTFGANCNETCTCRYGQCDNGPLGTGVCKNGTCQLGFTGENCARRLTPCRNTTNPCGAFAACYLGEKNVPRCHCEPGYNEVGDQCLEIDQCASEDNGGCHLQATCTNIGPNNVSCECNRGWTGDGYVCVPSNPCQRYQRCPANARCFNVVPDQSHCVCKTGYSGDGSTCTLIDPCVENNGGCHPQATCTFVQDGERNCTCPENMGGDGVTCFGTIAREVTVHPDLTWLFGLMKVINDSSNVLDKLDNNSYTLFAPSDDAVKTFMSLRKWSSSYWQEKESALLFLRFHTVKNAYSTEDLHILEDVVKSYPTLFNGFYLRIIDHNSTLYVSAKHAEYASLVHPNIPALNGYIHVIDKVLEPFFPDEKIPSLTEALESQPKYKLFFQALQKTGVLDQIKQLEEYSLFVLTDDVLKELNRKITAEFLKYYVVEKRVITLSVLDNDTMDTLLGPQHKMLFTVSDSMVLVNGIEITQPDMLTVNGVIHELEAPIHPVLNRCDFIHYDWTLGGCGNCTTLEKNCPPGYVIRSQLAKYPCQLAEDGFTNQHRGCRPICIRITRKSVCCAGFYGPHCDECPGGADLSCSDRGACDDGAAGSGKCLCHKGFSGENCDRCESPGLVFPDCNINYNSCGYMNGNCSERATCTETSDGVKCQCHQGYVGDGYSCKSQCELQDNGGCHPQAVCSFNGSGEIIQCTCKTGFHGNGTWCQQNIDVCTPSNSHCDLERVVCIFPVPKVTDMAQGSPSCDCKSGYVGDGRLCSTDMLDALSRMSELDYFSSWLQEEKKLNSSSIIQLLSNRSVAVTVFVAVSKPVDSTNFVVVDGVHKLLPSQAIKDQNVADTNTGENSINKKWTLVSQNGQDINVTFNDQGQFFANGVRIIRTNVETFTGILHLTEMPIVSSKHEGNLASTTASGKDLTSTTASGKDLTSTTATGKDLTSTTASGRDLTSTTASGKDLTSTTSSGKDLASTTSSRKDLASTTASGKDLASTTSSGKDLTSTTASGKDFTSTVKSVGDVAASTAKTSSHLAIIVSCVVVAVIVVLVVVIGIIFYKKRTGSQTFRNFSQDASASISLSKLISEDSQTDSTYENPWFSH